MNKRAVISAAAFILMLSVGGVQAEPKGDMPQGAQSEPAVSPSGGDSSSTMKAPDAPSAVPSRGDEPNAGAPAQPGEGKAAGRKHDNSAQKSVDGNSADQKAAKKESFGDADRMSEDRDASTVKGAKSGEVDSNSRTQGSSKSPASEVDSSRKSSKSVKLEPQQIEKTRTYFRDHRPSIKSVDRSEISVSIGIALPGTITLYDLPPDVIVVSGACPVQYFLWGDDLVLVDSCTREVVEIIVGIA